MDVTLVYSVLNLLKFYIFVCDQIIVCFVNTISINNVFMTRIRL